MEISSAIGLDLPADEAFRVSSSGNRMTPVAL
jgi:hypothetical protein